MSFSQTRDDDFISLLKETNSLSDSETKLPEKRVLITGGSGFIGTNLINYCISKGLKCLNIDIKEPRDKSQDSFWLKCDVRNESDLQEAVLEFCPDYVFHLAAVTDFDGKTLEDYSSNTDGTKNVKDVLKLSNNISMVVFVSSQGVCNGDDHGDESFYNPVTLYGQSKVIGEELVKTDREICYPWVIVRPTSIWGPWFEVPYKHFFERVMNGKYYHIGRDLGTKSYGYVENVVHEMFVLATHLNENNERKVFYVSDYEPTNICEWAEIIRIESRASRIRNVPYLLAKGVALGGDLLKKIGIENPPLTTFRLNNMLTDVKRDLTPTRSVVGELPFDLRSGVRRTIQWMRNFV